MFTNFHTQGIGTIFKAKMKNRFSTFLVSFILRYSLLKTFSVRVAEAETQSSQQANNKFLLEGNRNLSAIYFNLYKLWPAFNLFFAVKTNFKIHGKAATTHWVITVEISVPFLSRGEHRSLPNKFALCYVMMALRAHKRRGEKQGKSAALGCCPTPNVVVNEIKGPNWRSRNRMRFHNEICCCSDRVYGNFFSPSRIHAATLEICFTGTNRNGQTQTVDPFLLLKPESHERLFQLKFQYANLII